MLERRCKKKWVWRKNEKKRKERCGTTMWARLYIEKRGSTRQEREKRKEEKGSWCRTTSHHRLDMACGKVLQQEEEKCKGNIKKKKTSCSKPQCHTASSWLLLCMSGKNGIKKIKRRNWKKYVILLKSHFYIKRVTLNLEKIYLCMSYDKSRYDYRLIDFNVILY